MAATNAAAATPADGVARSGRLVAHRAACCPSRSSGRRVDAAGFAHARISTASCTSSGRAVSGRPSRAEYGSGSTVHRRFQRWVELGCFEAIWRRLLQHYDDEIGLQWRWQSADASLHKAPLGGEKNRPQSHRSRQERHQAAPSSPTAPASRSPLPSLRRTGPTRKRIAILLDARVVRAPAHVEQHLCLDKGYDYADAERAVRRRRYIPHIRRRGEERRRMSPRDPGAPLGGRTDDLVVQSVPQAAHPLGEEGAELPRARPLRRRAHRVARTCGIGS